MVDPQLTQSVISWEQRKVVADDAWQKIVAQFKVVYDQAASRQISREQYQAAKAEYDDRKAQYDDFLQRYEAFYAEHPGLREEIEQTKSAVIEGAPRPGAPPPDVTSSYQQQIDHEPPKERAPLEYRPEDRVGSGAPIAPASEVEDPDLDRRLIVAMVAAAVLLIAVGLWLLLSLFGGDDQPTKKKPQAKPQAPATLVLTDEDASAIGGELLVDAKQQPPAEATAVAGNLFSSDGLAVAQVDKAAYFKFTSPQVVTNVVVGTLKDAKAASVVVDKTKALIKPPITPLQDVQIKGADAVVGLVDKACPATIIQVDSQLVSVITSGPAGTCVPAQAKVLQLQHGAVVEAVGDLID